MDISFSKTVFRSPKKCLLKSVDILDRKLYIFDFSSHTRQVYRLMSILKYHSKYNVNISSYAHCSSFYLEDSDSHHAPIINLSKLRLFLKFFSVIIFHKKADVFIATPPEHSSLLKKWIFIYLLIFCDSYRRTVVFLRDMSPGAGDIYLRNQMFTDRFRIVCESPWLCHHYTNSTGRLASGFIVPGFYPLDPLYASKSLDTMLCGMSVLSNQPTLLNHAIIPTNSKRISLGLLGGLNFHKRNYTDFLNAILLLRNLNYDISVNVLGCFSDDGLMFFSEISELCIVNYPTAGCLTDDELDNCLLASDLLVCCNKYSFFGDFKGSGVFGDAFSASKHLLIHNEFKPLLSGDSDFLSAPISFYANGTDLANIIIDLGLKRSSDSSPGSDTSRWQDNLLTEHAHLLDTLLS